MQEDATDEGIPFLFVPDETWIEIPEEIMENTKLSLTARCLYGVVYSLPWCAGQAPPTAKYLAKKIAASERTVKRAFKELGAAGLLPIKNRCEL